MTVRRPRNDQNRRSIPCGKETLAKRHGGITPPDQKEMFAIGPDETPNEPYFTGPLAYPDFAPSLWPENSAELKRAMVTYYDGMLGLARLLADIYEHARDMPERFFVERLSRHSCQLRLLHYPATSRRV
jgi:isopenicillin N synthase-like dioxygenase